MCRMHNLILLVDVTKLPGILVYKLVDVTHLPPILFVHKWDTNTTTIRFSVLVNVPKLSPFLRV